MIPIPSTAEWDGVDMMGSASLTHPTMLNRWKKRSLIMMFWEMSKRSGMSQDVRHIHLVFCDPKSGTPLWRHRFMIPITSIADWYGFEMMGSAALTHPTILWIIAREATAVLRAISRKRAA